MIPRAIGAAKKILLPLPGLDFDVTEVSDAGAGAAAGAGATRSVSEEPHASTLPQSARAHEYARSGVRCRLRRITVPCRAMATRFAGTQHSPGLFDVAQDISGGLPLELIEQWLVSDQSRAVDLAGR